MYRAVKAWMKKEKVPERYIRKVGAFFKEVGNTLENFGNEVSDDDDA